MKEQLKHLFTLIKINHYHYNPKSNHDSDTKVNKCFNCEDKETQEEEDEEDEENEEDEEDDEEYQLTDEELKILGLDLNKSTKKTD